jgi:thioesterase domain-containing protein
LPQLAELLATFAAHIRALASYAPRPYAGGMILLRAGEGSLPAGGDPTLGWGTLAAGGLVVSGVPGDHYSMLEPPRVATLALRIEAELAAAASTVCRGSG